MKNQFIKLYKLTELFFATQAAVKRYFTLSSVFIHAIFKNFKWNTIVSLDCNHIYNMKDIECGKVHYKNVQTKTDDYMQLC